MRLLIWNIGTKTLKIKKKLTPKNIAVIIIKLEKKSFYNRLMGPKAADSIVTSVDPGPTARLTAP